MERQIIKKQSNQQRARIILNNQINSKELLQQLNILRQKPQMFYSLISARKQYYNKKGMLFSSNFPNRSINTTEGRQPLNEILQALINMNPLNPIAYNSDLNEATQTITNKYITCNKNNQTFELSPKQLRQALGRSQKYIFPHPIQCVIGVGFCDQYEPLFSLLIDDGVPARKNRKILLSEEYEVCGIDAQAMGDCSLVCAVYLFTKSVISKSKISL